MSHRPLFASASSRAVLAILVALGLLTIAGQVGKPASPDIAFLLYAGDRVLDGARLYRDVVEINPPLIVWFNAGVAWVARATHFSPFLVYRVAALVVVAALLGVCARLLRRAIPEPPELGPVVLVVLGFALLPFAGDDFGQREHFVAALLTPYLLLVAVRTGSSVADVSARGAAGVGVLAGLALALKPHFAILWLALEGFARVRRPSIRWRLTPELAGAIATLALYGAAIAAFTPEYFTVALALGPAYTRYLREPLWSLLLTAPGAALVFFALLARVALRRYVRDPNLIALLTTVVVAAYLSGVAQEKGLPYHFYPAQAFAFVLLALIALDAPREGSLLTERIYSQAVRAVLATLVVVSLGGAVLEAAGGSPAERAARADLAARAEFIRSRAGGRPVGVLSYHLDGAFPLLTYAGVRLASRFPHLWLVATSYWDALAGDAPLRYHEPSEMGPTERFVWDAVRTDLTEARPALLLVLRPARDAARNGLRRLNYIEYFGRDPGLARLFERYELVATQREYLVYQEIPAGGQRTGPSPSAPLETGDVQLGTLSGMRVQLADPGFAVGGIVFVLSWGLIVLSDRRARLRA